MTRGTGTASPAGISRSGAAPATHPSYPARVADGRSVDAARTGASTAADLGPVGVVEWTSASVTPVPGDRLWTVPNLVSGLRLAGVPLFVYLLLGPHQDFWAIVVLGVGGATDWLDGKLARLLGQYSRFGALLDAVTDRLYILAALLALGMRDIVPWWLVAVLVGRDVVLSACLPLLRIRGYGPFVVTYLGKAATFLLFWAFPVLLAGWYDNWFGALCRSVGPALTGWATALYLYAGLLYLAQVWIVLRSSPATSSEPGTA